MLAYFQEEPTVFGKWTAGLRGDKDRRPVTYRQSGPVLSNGTTRLRHTEMGIERNAGGQFGKGFNLSDQTLLETPMEENRESRAPIWALYWTAVRDERQNERRSKAQLARYLLVVWPTQLHRRHCRTRSRGADSTCHRNQLSQRDNGSFVRALKQSQQAEGA